MKKSTLAEMVTSWMLDGGYSNFTIEEANDLLDVLQFQGMLPPQTDNKCSDPELSIGPSYFDEHVPQRIVCGWDDE